MSYGEWSPYVPVAKRRVKAAKEINKLRKKGMEIQPINIRKQCAGQIGSMLELLRGRFSDNVMEIVTDQNKGLFPKPSEINLACDCPDWTEMCKHIAAALYGVSRLKYAAGAQSNRFRTEHYPFVTAYSIKKSHRYLNPDIAPW